MKIILIIYNFFIYMYFMTTQNIDNLFKKAVKYEIEWCKFLKIRNPYVDNFNVHFSRKMPLFDGPAYKKYPAFQNVYDKLWVTKSQQKNSGTLDNILNSKNEIKFPIFIKPRYGHKSASSKGCYKIKNIDELKQHVHKKKVMWSEFYKGNETMTDFVLVNGKIAYQLTYIYSKPINGFTDEWKYISPDSKPPVEIEKWVNKHMKNYSGICNVQYRKNSIIEISLRPARGGAYLQSTNNELIIKNINNVIEKNVWVYLPKEELDFKPYYSFKCFIKYPILYLLPQHSIDIIMYSMGAKSFYEYYFEPVGNDGSVFFQFLHNDYKTGLHLKYILETLFVFLQLLFVILFIIPLVLFFYFKKPLLAFVVLFVVMILFSSKYINPINSHYRLWKLHKQQLGIDGNNDDDDDNVSEYHN